MAVSSADDAFFIDLTDGKEFVVNRVVGGGYWGSQHVICLGSNRLGAGPDGKLRSEATIIARLRFDNDMAKILREALDQQIKALETPPNEKAN